MKYRWDRKDLLHSINKINKGIDDEVNETEKKRLINKRSSYLELIYSLYFGKKNDYIKSEKINKDSVYDSLLKFENIKNLYPELLSEEFKCFLNRINDLEEMKEKKFLFSLNDEDVVRGSRAFFEYLDPKFKNIFDDLVSKNAIYIRNKKKKDNCACCLIDDYL